GLPADGLAGIFGLTLVGLPALADDVLVGCDHALGGHAQSVGLDTHVGGELTLALGGAFEPDRAVAILIAHLVGEPGGRVLGLGDSLGIELPRPVGRPDMGTDDPLEMDLHGLL